jgi:hypothetical protein
VKKYIRNVSYRKRLTRLLRSERRPLIMGRRKGANFGAIERGLERFGCFWGFGGTFEEGELT